MLNKNSLKYSSDLKKYVILVDKFKSLLKHYKTSEKNQVVKTLAAQIAILFETRKV